MKKEKGILDSMQLKQQKNLDGIVEKGYCFIKMRVRSMLELKSLRTAILILSGMKVMYMMKKGNFTKE
ncbi:hypothetical protein BVG01_06880 [Bacillus anthracis]|nr:hypothetical protein BVG01_06880 [Bacillus anthracis]